MASEDVGLNAEAAVEYTPPEAGLCQVAADAGSNGRSVWADSPEWLPGPR